MRLISLSLLIATVGLILWDWGHPNQRPLFVEIEKKEDILIQGVSLQSQYDLKLEAQRCLFSQESQKWLLFNIDFFSVQKGQGTAPYLEFDPVEKIVFFPQGLSFHGSSSEMTLNVASAQYDLSEETWIFEDETIFLNSNR